VPTTYSVAQYIAELRAIRATGSATAETSYYPPFASLLNAVGQTLKPPVLFSTQVRDSGAGIPDGGLFPQPKRQRRSAEPELLQNPERGVVEIKPADYNLDTLSAEPQTLRYLSKYGLVLITNLRQFRLLSLDSSGAVRTLEHYTLAATAADLWQAPIHSFDRHKDLLPDFLTRALLYRAPLVQPKDVAWLLASYAREARARVEDHPLRSFDAVKTALQESLGMRFEGEKGEHFFRSTLVQTLFYGIFSAWVLWRRSHDGRQPGARFDWRLSAHYLRVPVLRKLFGEVADPGALNSAQLQEVLNLAGEALNRVQPAFFDTFREDEAVAYFYEPFLEAFDPQLRKDLGVWYTPREIVEYMVERVDQLLRSHLNQPLGLASPAVRILDPCCGTGAYLTAVLHRIHRTLLENAGDDTALVPNTLRTAALTRVFGFEIMPAPFVIAHLQIAALLEKEGAPLTDQHRAGVYLTNSLTGWVPERHPQSAIFREFEKEREDSENIKQQGTILVILGNPPYNGYAGIAQIDEERDLTTAYREPIPGLPAPQGQGLNDLYIRFFRIAERRIVGDAHVHGNEGGCGIVSFISNNNWLDGLSHVSMRARYIDTFQSIYIDNLNGDKYRTGKTTPDGKPDPSAFSTPQNREGIQVGTAISTLVRTAATPPTWATEPTQPAQATQATGLVTKARLQPGHHETKDSRALAPEGSSSALREPTSNEAAALYQGATSEPALSAAERVPQTPQNESRALAPAEALDGAAALKGHDFSRAMNANESARALAPEGRSLQSQPTPQIHLRDLWGTGKLAHLRREAVGDSAPEYLQLTPAPALGNPFGRRTFSATYTDWPRLPELFPISFPGIKTSRDQLVVDIDRHRLDARMKNYFDPLISHEAFAQELPDAMEDGYMYYAKEIRTTLQLRGFRPWEALRYCYRPFDLRWIYWEPETSLLRRKVEEYAAQMIGATVWIEARQRESGDTFARGTVVNGLADNFGNGLSNFFPAVVIEPATVHSPAEIRANLSGTAETYLDAIAAPRPDLFFHALATMHTPTYRTESAGALLGDWPRIPLPATADQLAHSASLGRRLAELLDAESSINLAAEWSFLAALKLPLDPNLDEALKLTAGWGHKGQGNTVMPGRGLAPERPWTETERQKLAALASAQFPTLQEALTLLGETCVDVYLNGNSHWSAVPILVWNYTLGGYQVLKKWLSYREFTPEPASPLLHRPLHPEEAAYFAQVVRRIAAILLMGPALDASYRAILPTATGLPAAK
jgi:hypothetical protein